MDYFISNLQVHGGTFLMSSLARWAMMSQQQSPIIRKTPITTHQHLGGTNHSHIFECLRTLHFRYTTVSMPKKYLMFVSYISKHNKMHSKLFWCALFSFPSRCVSKTFQLHRVNKGENVSICKYCLCPFINLKCGECSKRSSGVRGCFYSFRT